jgi:hypothetical protein
VEMRVILEVIQRGKSLFPRIDCIKAFILKTESA